jgi:hypothetical protein
VRFEAITAVFVLISMIIYPFILLCIERQKIIENLILGVCLAMSCYKF